MIPIILKDVAQKNREPRLLLAPAHLGPRDGLREALRALGAPLLEPHGLRDVTSGIMDREVQSVFTAVSQHPALLLRSFQSY